MNGTRTPAVQAAFLTGQGRLSTIRGASLGETLSGHRSDFRRCTNSGG